MRLGKFREGFLVPYPDITLLPLQATGFGNFKSDKYELTRMDPTQEMQRVFGKSDRIYYVEGDAFPAYCKKRWQDVKIVEVNDIPDPPSRRPRFYAIGTCKKCKRTYIIDTGLKQEKDIIERLKLTPFGAQKGGPLLPFGECPANGWHTEMGSMWDNMDFDLSNTYHGGNSK